MNEFNVYESQSIYLVNWVSQRKRLITYVGIAKLCSRLVVDPQVYKSPGRRPGRDNLSARRKKFPSDIVHLKN